MLGGGGAIHCTWHFGLTGPGWNEIADFSGCS